MEITCIASSSKGNCYLVKSGTFTFLLDAGVKIEKINQYVNLNNVDFAFISHNHKDHSRSVENLRNSSVLIVSNKETQELNKTAVKSKFGDNPLILIEIPVAHGEEPNNALVVWNQDADEMLLYATDFNKCESNLEAFPFTDVIIECNYLEDKLVQVEDFKTRRQINTHMGFEGCINFLSDLNLSFCKNIYLCHLSDSLCDEFYVGVSTYGRFKIPTHVCKTFGGVESYGK